MKSRRLRPVLLTPLLGFAVVPLGACSSGEEADSGPGGSGGGGSRLVALERRVDDQAFVSGVIDTTTNTTCTFRKTGTEKGTDVYHCITGLLHAELVFLDDQCTEPALRIYDGSECFETGEGDLVETYVARTADCSENPHPFAVVGAKLEPESVYMRSYEDGSCGEAGMGDPIHELEPADFSAFVSATPRREPLSGGPDAIYLDGDDGSSFFHRFEHDGEPCSVDQMADGSTICLPSVATVDDSLFPSENCDGGPIARSWLTCRSPAYAVDYTPVDGCERLDSIRFVGEEVETAFQMSLDECVASPLQGLRSVGDEVPRDELSLLTHVVEGSGRLRLDSLADLDGNVLRPWDWYDSELESNCYPQTFAEDGVTRCVVPNVQYTEDVYFKDADCTEPVYGVFEGGCGSFENEVHYFTLEREESTTCAPPLVTGGNWLVPYEGTVYENFGECLESTNLAENGFATYEAGDAVDFSMFAEMPAEAPAD